MQFRSANARRSPAASTLSTFRRLVRLCPPDHSSSRLLPTNSGPAESRHSRKSLLSILPQPSCCHLLSTAQEPASSDRELPQEHSPRRPVTLQVLRNPHV